MVFVILGGRVRGIWFKGLFGVVLSSRKIISEIGSSI